MPGNVRLQLTGLWRKDGRCFVQWNPQSRKTIFLARRILQDQLKHVLYSNCRHIKGHGGVKCAVRDLMKQTGDFRFVGRFDIASYYESMQHHILLGLLEESGVDETLQAVVQQYLKAPDLSGSGCGMMAGGSLSPLLGALYLSPLDAAMLRLVNLGQIYYVRYMDDMVILAKTRWHLRAAIRILTETIQSLGLTLHRVKRFVGRIEKGFDFLGYQIHPSRRLRPSPESLRRLSVRARRLYEQGASSCRLWQYVSRWTRWLWAGMDGLVSRKGGVKRYMVPILKQLRINGISLPRA